VKRGLGTVAGLAATLVLAAPASAAAPELFVRTQKWDTHEETGAWMPLAAAPSLDYLGGYEIGYRLQTAGFQRVALTIAAVPDGAPTQPSNAPPYCVGRSGAVGDIVPAGPELQFEGNGTYTVKVSVGPGLDCLTSGESNTGSFAVDVHVAPSLVGSPLSFRAVALPGAPFVGVRAPAPPGGQAEVRCALDATVQGDGSVTGRRLTGSGPSVPEFVFPRPGAWTCVARGTAEGSDDNLDTTVFGTPWSSPLTFDVRSDFRRRVGRISKPRSKRPRFSFKAEWPDVAAGGRARLTLFRVAGCKGRRYKLRKVATYRGRFGANRARITIRRPRRVGFYVGRFAFSGTHFLNASIDPNPLLLAVLRDRLEYVPRRDFLPC
jgi:hypothetical protein